MLIMAFFGFWWCVLFGQSNIIKKIAKYFFSQQICLSLHMSVGMFYPENTNIVTNTCSNIYVEIFVRLEEEREMGFIKNRDSE